MVYNNIPMWLFRTAINFYILISVFIIFLRINAQFLLPINIIQIVIQVDNCFPEKASEFSR